MRIMMQGCVRLTFTIKNPYWSPPHTQAASNHFKIPRKHLHTIHQRSSKFFLNVFLQSNLFYQTVLILRVCSFFRNVSLFLIFATFIFFLIKWHVKILKGRLRLKDFNDNVRIMQVELYILMLCRWNVAELQSQKPFMWVQFWLKDRQASLLERFVLSHDTSLLGQSRSSCALLTPH